MFFVVVHNFSRPVRSKNCNNYYSCDLNENFTAASIGVKIDLSMILMNVVRYLQITVVLY